MAKREYKFKVRGCKTTEQGMKKLVSPNFKIEKVNEGEDNLIAFTVVKNPFYWRFFGILHEEEKEIYITGVFETTAVLKIIFSLAVFITIMICGMLAYMQVTFIPKNITPVYVGNMNPTYLPFITWGSVAVIIICLLRMIVHTHWLLQSKTRANMIEELEKITGCKCVTKY